MNTNLSTAYTDLLDRLRRASDLRSAGAVLSWDQTTYMPPAGAPARGRQLALLEELAHQEATAPEIGRLLEQLTRELDNLDPY